MICGCLSERYTISIRLYIYDEVANVHNIIYIYKDNFYFNSIGYC